MTDVLRRSRSDEATGEPPVEVFEGHRVIRDASQTLELYDIGPNPHADELVILFFPKHRILYVADVFSADWGRVRPAIPETLAFAARLEALDLDVEVILPSHGARSTIDDLRAALAGSSSTRWNSSFPSSSASSQYHTVSP